MTARCCCKFRYISKFTAASRGFHCHSNAFELNESPDELTATFAEICNGHLFRSILRTCVQNWKFVALPVPEIIGDTQEICEVPGYAHAPFSPKFLGGFCSDEPCKIYLSNLKFVVLPVPEIIGGSPKIWAVL